MKKTYVGAVLIIFALFILSCTAGEQNLIKEGHQALKGDKIRNLLSGNTIEGTYERGTYIIYFSPDGTQYGKTSSTRDKGKWWIEGDKYCRQWNKWSDHHVKCRKFYIVGEKLIWVLDGKITEKTNLPAAGNAENFNW